MHLPITVLGAHTGHVSSLLISSLVRGRRKQLRAGLQFGVQLSNGQRQRNVAGDQGADDVQKLCRFCLFFTARLAPFFTSSASLRSFAW